MTSVKPYYVLSGEDVYKMKTRTIGNLTSGGQGGRAGGQGNR